jgi:hypothetical protein
LTGLREDALLSLLNERLYRAEMLPMSLTELRATRAQYVEDMHLDAVVKRRDLLRELAREPVLSEEEIAERGAVYSKPQLPVDGGEPWQILLDQPVRLERERQILTRHPDYDAEDLAIALESTRIPYAALPAQKVSASPQTVSLDLAVIRAEEAEQAAWEAEQQRLGLAPTVDVYNPDEDVPNYGYGPFQEPPPPADEKERYPTTWPWHLPGGPYRR